MAPSSNEQVVVDCPTCHVRVKAEARDRIFVEEEEAAYFLVQCPTCFAVLLGYGEQLYDGHNYSWTTLKRIWPAPETAEIGSDVPEQIRKELHDAQKCLHHGIYSATAVLCGRAVERLVKEKASAKTLGAGLKALLDGGIIDQRLYEWAEALRIERNTGAHASDSEISKENAQDVMDFTVAIFDYVYTLREKYARYMARKQAQQPHASAKP